MSTLTDTDRRREWATALRWAAAEAARPFGGAQDGDLDSTDLREFADQIEAGATPWADTAPETAPSATETAEQPTPGAVAPPDREGAAEPVKTADGHRGPCPDVNCGCCYPLGVHAHLRDALATAQAWFPEAFPPTDPAVLEVAGPGLVMTDADRAVIDAARAWRATWSPPLAHDTHPADVALIAAVDALDNAAVNTPDGVNGAEAVDLDAIEARANAATPGRWQVIDPNEGSGVPPAWEVVNDAFLNPSGDDEPWIAVELHVGAGEDAQFIAHARADVPALVARVRQLETDLTELEHLFDLQWRRMGEATELWRAESPAERQLIQPDLGALLAWLMERAATARRVGAADALELARSEADGIDPAVDTVLAHLAAEVRRPHHPHPDH